MKSSLVWGSFLCIICLYMKLPGVGDGSYGHLGAGAGAGGHLGGGASIRSSSDGQDEAIDTPSILLRPLVRPVLSHVAAILYRCKKKCPTESSDEMVTKNYVCKLKSERTYT